MRDHGLRHVVMGVAFACASMAVSAWGQPVCTTANRAKAVRLAKQANARLAQKKYDAAMADLRAAYALCPEARLRHAMGCVAEASGALADAVALFRVCAAEATEDDLRSECRSRAEALEAWLRPPESVPKPAVAAPVPTPEPAPKPGPVPAPVAAGRADKVPEPAPEPAPVPAPASRPSAVWNWVGVGAGVGLIGMGAGFLGQYGKDRANARTTRWVDSEGYIHEPDTVKPTNAIVGGVAAGVGVAVLITTVVLWPKAPATVSVSAGPGAGGMVTLGGRW